MLRTTNSSAMWESMVQPTRRPCGNPWSEEIYGGLGEKVTSLPIQNDRVDPSFSRESTPVQKSLFYCCEGVDPGYAGVDPRKTQFFRVDPSPPKESTPVHLKQFSPKGVDPQFVLESTLTLLESTPAKVGVDPGLQNLMKNRQLATGSYEEGDMAVRPGGQVGTAVRSRSDHDGILVAICLRTRPIEPSRSQVLGLRLPEKGQCFGLRIRLSLF
ncbi:hypothetical protein Taro_040468 [Colocasia esculenta]|uniref:Uncharacterized protein n=1 Tax=Colocasia esculenta TaxID=4460 RepID=A0A843WQI2_COLES|nr:hypothetical protein [Colocasia esculenta]